jgi:hypothetical protein
VYVREKALAEFAEINRLPVITENCPGCFASPTEVYFMHKYSRIIFFVFCKETSRETIVAARRI